MAGRVLLVEDDASIGEVLAASLRSHAYDVAWERTGAEALARAAVGPLDLVLLDLGLPDLDGVEVCRQLRVSQPGCVLVMLTARSAEMDVVVGLEAGADDYLVKPVRLAELHARLRAHLRRGTGPLPHHLMAVVTQTRGQERPDRLVVLHHEDPTGHGDILAGPGEQDEGRRTGAVSRS